MRNVPGWRSDRGSVVSSSSWSASPLTCCGLTFHTCVQPLASVCLQFCVHLVSTQLLPTWRSTETRMRSVTSPSIWSYAVVVAHRCQPLEQPMTKAEYLASFGDYTTAEVREKLLQKHENV